ncbi:uncharacterized protein LOC114744042 [Neltuma alba]|uniref:uncharacterized protein LOC114744042 n=1 Tax=Neltuma alba TaxID=207710 RepID=UPI0010A57CA8|nr:uncharacterized protein LOC114744042 [Prosopis alba]
MVQTLRQYNPTPPPPLLYFAFLGVLYIHGFGYAAADGGINPSFQDKIILELTEIARELIVVVAKNRAFAPDEIDSTGRGSSTKFRECSPVPSKREIPADTWRSKSSVMGGRRLYYLQAAPSRYSQSLAVYPPFPYPPANAMPYYIPSSPSPYYPPPPPTTSASS